jgi:hypothetical protein
VDAFDQAEKRNRTEFDGNISDNFSREKSGRLSKVDGTDNETAFGRRAEEKAAFGRMSKMRHPGLLIKKSRSAGSTAERFGIDDVVFAGRRDVGDDKDKEDTGASRGGGIGNLKVGGVVVLDFGGLSKLAVKRDTELESNLLSIAFANESVDS